MAGFSKPRLARMSDVLSAHVARGELPGLVSLVSRRGEVHVEAVGTLELGGVAMMRRDTIFRIASMTKPVTAAAAMILVEECKLRLDDPVDDFLPELANRRVLTRIEAPLDDTVPAKRAITLRDLLTFKAGLGAVMRPPGTYPIQKAMADAGLSPGMSLLPVTPDEYMKRVGQLPLIHQPGEHWLYHTGSDILGVLIARASGKSFDTFLHDRIFAPLGMKDTAFFVPKGNLDRLAFGYNPDSATGALTLAEDPRDGRRMAPPSFPSGGAGLLSTVDDYHAFLSMMLNKGKLGDVRILSRPSVEAMTMDHLSDKIRSDYATFFDGNSGWGFGVNVFTKRDGLATTPGRFGWMGGSGTSGYVDPAEDMIGIIFTQRHLTSPRPPVVLSDFWTLAYQAFDD